MIDEDGLVSHLPQNKKTALSKLRRGGKNCPVCLSSFAKNAARTRLVKKCFVCQAQLASSKQCFKCSANAVWSNKTDATCQSCGLHGRKSEVIAKEL